MKQIASFVFVALLLLSSNPVKAQSTESVEYQALIQQLIETLIAQVQLLQVQLAELKDTQEEVKVETKRISERVNRETETVEEKVVSPKVSYSLGACVDNTTEVLIQIDGDWEKALSHIKGTPDPAERFANGAPEYDLKNQILKGGNGKQVGRLPKGTYDMSVTVDYSDSKLKESFVLEVADCE